MPVSSSGRSTEPVARVSCVVPTHLRVSTLTRALDSIERQELTPFEVLVVDDAADQETRQLIERRAPAFPCLLRYIDNSATPGACNSRNKGGVEAAGDMLAFLDDDDEWLPTFLDRCVAAITNERVNFALTYIDRCYPGGVVKPLKTSAGLDGKTVLKERVYMTGSSFVVQKDSFHKVGGFDPQVPVFNDWDLFIRMLRGNLTYAVIPEALVRWHEHDGVRITTGSLRRADGIDRFIKNYGDDMSVAVRSYYLRLATGIRKSFEPSRYGRAKLTASMMYTGGLPMIAYLVSNKLGSRTNK